MSTLFRSAVLLLGALFATSALAQPGPDDDGVDPPSRVARLSFIRGAVSFVPAGENDWVEAQLNRPLITGDKLWSDHGSRAELEIGAAVMRIDEETSFDFLNLDDDMAQVELTQGALNLRVRRLYDNQTYEIDTPTLAFVVNRVGEYRVTIAPDGQSTSIAILRGAGDAYGEDGARFRIEEGQFVTFNDSQLRDYYTDSLPRPDDFDEFIAQRDERWDRARSRQYVSEDVIGYEDLDDNGDWEDVAEYGHVWYPTTVAVGWTPYHYGHWGWVGAYGWTWIDDAPWGFAPFHYGRWANIRGRWGWCPGPIAVRPYYAPALVAFIGGGVSVSVGVGGGPVGWFPLGPRDVWFPGYRVSRGYFTRVNVSNTVVNTTIINNYYGNYSRGRIDYGAIGYHNRNVAGAVVAVPATAFVSARPVHAAAIAVNRQTFANARVSAFAAVAPTRASLVAANARAVKAPPSAVVDRRIVAATRPPAPIASFATREAVLQKNPGRPLNTRELRTLPAVQNGARTAAVNERGAVNQRANVKVVTNAGVPARTPAAPLVTRGNANANAGNARGNGADNNRRAPNANDNARGANAGDNRRATVGADNARQGNPADNTRREAPGNRDANARENPNARGGNGRGNQPLDSSRFVRGNPGNAEGNGRGQGNANAENGQRQMRQVTPPQQQPANARQASGASDNDNVRRGGNNAGNNPRSNPAGSAGDDDRRGTRSAGGSTPADNAQRQIRSQDESRGNDNGRSNDNARRAQQESQRLEQQQQQQRQQQQREAQMQQQQQREQQQAQRQHQQQQEQQQQRQQAQYQRQQQQQQEQQREQAQFQRQQQQQQQQEQVQRQQQQRAAQQQQQQQQQQNRQPPPQPRAQQNQGNDRGNSRDRRGKDKDDDKNGGGH